MTSSTSEPAGSDELPELVTARPKRPGLPWTSATGAPEDGTGVTSLASSNSSSRRLMAGGSGAVTWRVTDGMTRVVSAAGSAISTSACPSTSVAKERRVAPVGAAEVTSKASSTSVVQVWHGGTTIGPR